MFLDKMDFDELYHTVCIDVIEIVISQELADSLAVFGRLEDVVAFFTLFNEFREDLNIP